MVVIGRAAAVWGWGPDHTPRDTENLLGEELLA